MMANRHVFLLLIFIAFCTKGTFAQEPYSGGVQYIDIINWSHTDYGFTDHPLIVSEFQKRYIDIAIDYVERSSGNKSGERFTWTVESLDPLFKWWQEASAERRKLLLKAIDKGNIDVNIMPFNIQPMLNETETGMLLNWIPKELAAKLKPRIAIQNDVNGFPRAVAKRLNNQGVRYIWLGMNGRHPFEIPTMSWWQMPNGEKMLLWNGVSYWEGYNYFHDENWKSGQHEASNLQYSWPRNGEIFASDKQSVLNAYNVCMRKLKALQEKGYNYPILPLTFSNAWRSDNDGPYWGIVDFVKKWNEMGLKPSLRFSTATETMQRLEKSVGSKIQTLTGEFGDWWAFGLTALPREMAVARSARYFLQASGSPVFGALSKKSKERSESINRDICTFYEHTFASNAASRAMYEPQNQGTINESTRYAYKAYEFAKWQLAQQVRVMLVDSTAGLYAINSQRENYSGWVQVGFSALRDKSAVSLTDCSTGKSVKLTNDNGSAYFWIDNLPGESIRKYKISNNVTLENNQAAMPKIIVDEKGWPVSASWQSMSVPLFDGNIGNLTSYKFENGGWWGGIAELKEYSSSPKEQTKIIDTPNSIVYRQALDNDRLVKAERILEVYKKEPRVALKVIYDRKLHPRRETEVFYIDFPLPDKRREITTSNGGSVFRPYIDNISNTCKTYYVADSWVAYKMDDGLRVWSSKTSPIISFGKGEFFIKGVESEPKDSHLLRSMVYNNAWGINYPTEYSGEVVCEYDLFWAPENIDANRIQQITDTYIIKPILTIVPKAKEDASYRKWLNGEE